ncbi:hypothetical protein QUF72_12055 [Desulfobacterales bacterium HSG2]|nr:hypothetical protein [Desulfobacterales bacterium HSG2]
MELLLGELYENCNEEDWDCYGASPIEEAIIHRTIMFVKKVSDTFLGKLTTDNFCPNPHGTITIEFSSRKKYIQAEIGLTKINIIGELGANEEFTWENVDLSTQNMVVFDKILSLVYSDT